MLGIFLVGKLWVSLKNPTNCRRIHQRTWHLLSGISILQSLHTLDIEFTIPTGSEDLQDLETQFNNLLAKDYMELQDFEIFPHNYVYAMYLLNCIQSQTSEHEKLNALIEKLQLLSGRQLLQPELEQVTQLDVICESNCFLVSSIGSFFKAHWKNSAVFILKCFDIRLNHDLMLLLERDLRVWSFLEHENVLRLLAVCLNVDVPFLIVSYMSNGTFDEFLTRSPRSFNEKIKLLLDIAYGLRHLHNNDIIHGNLSIASIFVGIPGLTLDDKFRAVISDFGFAYLKQACFESIERKLDISVRWMPPERYSRNFTLQKSCDIFSFGMLAYQVFTGKPPFFEQQEDDIVREWIREGEIPLHPNKIKLDKKRLLKEDIPPLLWELMLDCWKYDPANRPDIDQICTRLESLKELPLNDISAISNHRFSVSDRRSDTSYSDLYLPAPERYPTPLSISHASEALGLNRGSLFINEQLRHFWEDVSETVEGDWNIFFDEVELFLAIDSGTLLTSELKKRLYPRTFASEKKISFKRLAKVIGNSSLIDFFSAFVPKQEKSNFRLKTPTSANQQEFLEPDPNLKYFSASDEISYQDFIELVRIDFRLLFWMSPKLKKEINPENGLMSLNRLNAWLNGSSLEQKLQPFIVNASDKKQSIINEIEARTGLTVRNNMCQLCYEHDLLDIVEIMKITGVKFDHLEASLFKAAALGNILKFKIVSLVTNNAFNSVNRLGQTPLHMAAKNGHLQVCRYLVENGANPEHKTVNDSRPIHAAASSGSVHVCKFLLSCGIDLEPRISNGWTPLHCAADHGSIETFKFLLDQGANLNSVTNRGSSCLHLASEEGNLEIVKYIVELGFEISSRNSYGSTPLHSASKGGKLEVFEYLLDQGLSTHFRTAQGFTVAHEAAFYGHLSILNNLHQRGIELNGQTGDGWTCLHLAASKGYYKICNFLLENGANTGSVDNYGMTPLHYSARNGHLKICTLLVDQGANVKAESFSGESCADMAKDKFPEVYEYLIQMFEAEQNYFEAKETLSWTEFLELLTIDFPLLFWDSPKFMADINPSGGYLTAKSLKKWLNGERLAKKLESYQTSPGNIDRIIEEIEARTLQKVDNNLYQLSYQFELVDVVQVMRHDHIPVDTLNATLLDAVRTKSIKKCLIHLIINPRCIFFRDDDGNTALHLAAELGSVHLCKLMLNKGIHVMTRNTKGLCPIHIACINGHLEILDYMINNGGQLDSNTNENQSLVHLAVQYGHIEICRYLMKFDLELEALDNHGASALHVAAAKGHLDICKLLVSRGAFIEQQTTSGMGPLHFAAQNGNLEVCEFLINQGSHLHIKTDSGATPLHLAAKGGYEELCELLVSKGADAKKVDNDGVSAIDLHPTLIETLDLTTNTTTDEKTSSEETKDFWADTSSSDNQESLTMTKKFQFLDVIQTLPVIDIEMNDFNEILKRNSKTPDVEEFPPIKPAPLTPLPIPPVLSEEYISVDTQQIRRKPKRETLTPVDLSRLSNFFDDNVKYFPEESIPWKEFLERLVIDYPLLFWDSPKLKASLNPTGGEITLAGLNNWLKRDTLSKKLEPFILKYGDVDRVFDEIESRIDKVVTTRLCKTCCDYEFLDIVHVMKNGGIPLEGVSGEIVKAAKTERIIKVQILLLIDPSSSNERDNSGAAPLHMAASTGNLDICRLLVDYHAEIDVPGPNGNTALHYAAKHGGVELVSYLINQGANPRVTNRDGWTPLFFAVCQGHMNVCDQLFKYDRSLVFQTNQNDGFTALHFAALNGNIELCKYFIKHGLQPDIKTKNDTNCLHFAASVGNLTLCEFLVINGVKTVSKNRDGWNASHFAALHGHLSVLEYLVKQGVRFSAIDIHGNSPLHLAAKMGNFEICEYLVSRGVVVNQKNHDGETCAELARAKFPKVYDFLSDTGTLSL